jgi:hypothetical protein
MAANAVVPALLELVTDKSLLEPPVNVLRLSLMPGGLAPHIVNLPEWRAHLLARLRHQIDVTADLTLEMLFRDLQACPFPSNQSMEGITNAAHAGIVVPFRLKTPAGILSFLSTTTVFGTPVDITLSELALETFFPADQASADALRAMVQGQTRP